MNREQNGLKCEFVYWQKEKEYKNALALQESKIERQIKEKKNLRRVVIAGACALTILTGALIASSRTNTAAVATAQTLTEYETAFEGGTMEERLQIAAEVNRLYGGVVEKDLPRNNAEFVNACKTITERLGKEEAENE